ncbi:MAG: LysM peptidoglycan-binding domain-containing protein [Myxococcales bacterium]
MRPVFHPSFRQVAVLATLACAGSATSQLVEPTCRTRLWHGGKSLATPDAIELAGPTPPLAVERAAPASKAPAAASDDDSQEEDLDDQGEAEGPSDELQSAKEVEARALASDEALRLLRARAFAEPGAGSPLASRIHDALDGDGAGARADAREEQAIQEEIERFATFDIGSAASHYDIPVELNEQVSQYIRLFQGPLRDHFVLWLSRATRYVPRMREILVSKGLPSDTVYLSLIESGFNALAYSRARAAGQWQFIATTGRRFGLRSDFWVDERRDPEKATAAAAAYLTELHAQLGSWYLAWAGYNAGAGTIFKAVRRGGTSDFWSLVRGHVLKSETKGYVPKLIAAALIAKHPHAFGFDDVAFLPPLEYEEVPVSRPTDLDVVAAAASVDVSVIRELNPALRRFCTPPTRDGTSWTLRVPVGTGAQVAAALAALPKSAGLAFKYHKVAAGETLEKIARDFGVPAAGVARMNGLRKTALKPGRELVVPVPATESSDARVAAVGDERETGRRRRVWRWRHGRKHWYFANGGSGGWLGSDDGQDPWHPRDGQNAESLELAAATALAGGSPTPAVPPGRVIASLPAGEKSVEGAPPAQSPPAPVFSRLPAHAPPRPRPPPVPEEPPPADAVKYRVVEGDTLWSIAQSHGDELDQLCRWNRIGRPAHHKLFPGQELWVVDRAPAASPPAVASPIAPPPAAAVATHLVAYQVQDGDSLWEISRRFKVKIADIQQSNHLDDQSTLQPGMTLQIAVAGPTAHP